MTSAYNVLKDLAADPLSIREFAVDAATVIEIGDLCWQDVNDVKNAAHADLWTGSLAGTRGRFAEKFVGVAISAHSAADGANVTKVRVASRAVVRMAVGTATTFEIGDHVIGSRDGVTNTLLDQTVEKQTGTSGTTDPNDTMAIGRVSQREASSVSMVQFEIQGRGVAGGGVRAFLTS